MIFELKIETRQTQELIEITKQIQEKIKALNMNEGRLLVFVPHTTAGVTINENADPDVQNDILLGLNALGLEKLNFRHGEGNSPAHIKAMLTGSSVQVIIAESRLMLGTWQGIYFCEFDGPRTRKVLLQVL